MISLLGGIVVIPTLLATRDHPMSESILIGVPLGLVVGVLNTLLWWALTRG
jgi:hypothetical protein